MTITLYELRGPRDERYSLFAWRTRMALAHKGLTPRYEGVALSDKAAIAFSGGTTVPVIRDGDHVVRDSWAIATHLEDAYPDRPSLFGGPEARALAHLVNGWADRTLLPMLAPMVAADVHDRLDPTDRAHLRSRFEKAFGATLETLRAGRDAKLPAFRQALEPLRVSLKARPYLTGDAPAYADYIVFSLLQWSRIASPLRLLGDTDPLAPWFERLLDAHGGLGRSHPAADPDA